MIMIIIWLGFHNSAVILSHHLVTFHHHFNSCLFQVLYEKQAADEPRMPDATSKVMEQESVATHQTQSWALSVFFKFFNDKKYFVAFFIN